MTTDWLFWLGGGLLGLAGLWLCYWSLLADRAKGRKRCPKCWYNMQAAENLRCPECGKTVKTERKLLKTHRRWRWSFVSVILLLGSFALELTPKAQRDGWKSIIPTVVLITAVGYSDNEWVFNTLTDRIAERTASYQSYFSYVKEDALEDWQWRLLATNCKRSLQKNRSEDRRQQVLWLLEEVPPHTELIAETLVEVIAEGNTGLSLDAMRTLWRLYERERLSPSDRKATVLAILEVWGEEYSYEFHNSAAFYLVQLDPQSEIVFETLRATAQTADKRVRRGVIGALSEFESGDPQATSFFQSLLSDEEIWSRKLALSYLARDPKQYTLCLPLLEKGLNDTIVGSRSHSVQLLGSMGKAAAAMLPKLEILKKDENEFVRDEAQKAIDLIEKSITEGSIEADSP